MPLRDRKDTRLSGYDYSTPGAYFVTICTKDREEILGRIVGGGACDAPRPRLSVYGKIAEKYIRVMNVRRADVAIEKYVIMPNHIHMLIVIQGNKANSGTSQAPSPTNHTIPLFISLYKRYCNRESGRDLWQRSYYDHIVRGEQDYREIWRYIDENPIKWELDEFHPLGE